MRRMKILLLVNWHIKYLDKEDPNIQPSDQCFDKKFWFFKYFKNEVEVDVVDTRSFKWIEQLEKNKLRFYFMQTFKVLPRLTKYDLIISHGTTSGIFLYLKKDSFYFPNTAHQLQKSKKISYFSSKESTYQNISLELAYDKQGNLYFY